MWTDRAQQSNTRDLILLPRSWCEQKLSRDAAAQQSYAHALLLQHVSLYIQTEVKNITLTEGGFFFF